MSATISEIIGQKCFLSNRYLASINLLYTYKWMTDHQSEIFKEFGILSQHFNVLKIVNGNHPHPISPGEVLKVMLDKKRDLTRLINKLVSIGYLTRAYDPDNRRKVNLTITQKGRKITKELEAKLVKLGGQINKLTDGEAEQLTKLLDKLRGCNI